MAYTDRENEIIDFANEFEKSTLSDFSEKVREILTLDAEDIII